VREVQFLANGRAVVRRRRRFLNPKEGLMDVARRVRFGLAALVIAVGSAVFVVPASADTQPDPQLSNIPYLAWRGEQVRLVKCDPGMFTPFLADGVTPASVRQAVEQRDGPLDLFFNADFILVDWSGDPHLAAPQLEPGTVSFFFRSFDDAPCASAVFESPKAGLAQIKLAVTFNPVDFPGLFRPDTPAQLTGKHDFLVGWMTINSSVVQNISANPITGSPGPIEELPDTTNDLQVLVTGSIPLLQNFGELGLGDQIVMPTDWARLASAVATFRDPAAPNPASFWDIHDEFSPTASPDADLHGSGSQTSCDTNTTGFVDTVDNCEPAPGDDAFAGNVPTLFEIGAFSRVWQGFTNPTVGPFDPQRPFETLLSNGTLDEGDAPMPSARVDFNIAPNTPGGINGVGSFCTIPPQLAVQGSDCLSVDKHEVYSRDGAGTGDEPHNLYGPFYAEYLPAAFPAPLVKAGRNQPEASGIDGPPHGNNFPGFLNDESFYHFWDVLNPLNFAVPGPTGCALFVNPDTTPNPSRLTPEGFQTVSVYTDEHGEARVRFNSGTGFFFDNLPGILNANGGCDLAGIPVLGTAEITATAKYPYQPVTAQPVTSNVLTKVIVSGFSKTLVCGPKGPGEANSVAAICVARAIDITGNPFVGETVCFTADFNASSIMPFFGVVTIGGTTFDLSGSQRDLDAEQGGTNRICTTTNSAGLAAVEIINSNPTTVDVTAFFVQEGIFRSIKVPFPITGQVGPVGTTEAAKSGSSGPPTGSTGPTSGTTTGPGSTTGGNTGNTSGNTKPTVKYSVAMAKLVRTSKTRATMIVRVKGPAGKATLRIKLRIRNRTLTYTRKVTANKTVKIRGLKVPNAKGALRASISIVS
jgi:hypothetical protein